MISKNSGFIALAISISLMLVPYVRAQSAVETRSRRPSVEGPSATIDRVGSYNTIGGVSNIGRQKDVYSFDFNYSSSRQFGAQMSNYSRQVQAGRSQNIFSPAGRVFGLPDSAGVPPNYGEGKIGRFGSPQLRYRPLVQNAANPEILKSVTGFDDALSEYTPLLGWRNPRIEPPPEVYFAQPYGDSSFHKFFELQPAAEPLPPPTGKQLPSVATLMQNENEAHLKQLEGQAILVFKQGMTRTTENRLDRLAQALNMLTSVTRLKKDSSIAPLLAVHAALAKDKSDLAIRMLYQAVDRNPNVLTEHKNIVEYYGDKQLLDELMQEYQRIGDQSGSPDGFAIQAYVAWVMGDRGRAEQALSRMAKSSVGLASGRFRDQFAYILTNVIKQ